MFYTHVILSKRGPLSRVWLAAHWDKKLSKSNILEIDIDSSIEAILKPKVRISLRTSGHLLLGLSRIHSRKINYMLADCNDIVLKIKMTFRVAHDMDTEKGKDLTDTLITLQEIHEFDSVLPENSDFNFEYLPFNNNQSAPESITLKENFYFKKKSLENLDDDGFGCEDAASIYSFIFNSHTEDESIGVPMKAENSSAQIEGNLTEMSNKSGELNKIIEKTIGYNHSVYPRDSPLQSSFRVPALNDSNDTIVAEPLSLNPLLRNNSSSFVLEPLDPNKVTASLKKTKKRKKVLIDDVKGISSEAMKLQMQQEMSHEFDIASSDRRSLVGKSSDISDRFLTTWSRMSNFAVAGLIRDILNKNLHYTPNRQRDLFDQDEEGGRSIEKTRFQHSLMRNGDMLDNISSASKRMCEFGPLGSMQSSVPHDYEPMIGPLIDSMPDFSVPDVALTLESDQQRMDLESNEDENELIPIFPNYNKPPTVDNLFHGAKVQDLAKQINSEFAKTNMETSFDVLVAGKSRKAVAAKFYSLLVLIKHNVVHAIQNDINFGRIIIQPGSRKI